MYTLKKPTSSNPIRLLDPLALTLMAFEFGLQKI